MKVCLKLTLALSLVLVAAPFVFAQNTAQVVTNEPTAGATNGDNDDKNKKKAPAEEKPNPETAGGDPLVRLLVSKGVLSAADAAAIGTGTPTEQRDRLAALLVQKGLISATEFDAVKSIPANTVSVVPAVATSSNAAAEKIIPSSEARPTTNAVAQAQPPVVIPAIAPIRVLQLEGTKRDGLLPDIKLGSGAKLKLYGFYKVAVIHDTSSPTGNDFPLPGFLNDSGPNGSPEFHLKARSLRLGANFEWLDPLPKVTLTGRAEIDFEGDFPRANSRNIAAIRSNQPNLRLAWMRVDYAQNDKLGWHVLFGQDWTPFASSTNPQTIETTGFHLGYGNIYQRLPQIRFGVNYLLAKNRNVRFQPEVAIALPLIGNLPLNVADQLGFGERQGVDSQRPELQGRFVLQFQLDKAPGVVPAQLIASWMQSQRKAIVTRETLTTAINGNAGLSAAQRTAILNNFVGGAEVDSNRYGWTAEAQLPTRYFTVVSKYYNGEDLRGYFAGQLFSIYNDTFGLTNTTNVLSIDGSSTTVVGFLNGVPTFAPQRAIRQQGGFVNIGFPLSRWFNIDPKSRLAGFQGYLHYGYEEAKPRDVRRLNGTTLNPIGQFAQSLGANRSRSDVFMGSLHYRVNSFVTFAYEQSYFRTRAANQAGALPLFRGIPSRETHSIRSEFATIFTF
jgi:hypothetical protein